MKAQENKVKRILVMIALVIGMICPMQLSATGRGEKSVGLSAGYAGLEMTRVAACVPVIRPGAVKENCESIIGLAFKATAQDASVVLFPELCVTGYTCGDLFHDSLLISEARHSLKALATQTAGLKAIIVVGVPIAHNGRLYNCAAVLHGGSILGIVPKYYLPNYNEFYEERWFASAFELKPDEYIEIDGEKVGFGNDLIFDVNGTKIGIEICEDLWVPEPPSGRLAKAGAEIILKTGRAGYVSCRCQQSP